MEFIDRKMREVTYLIPELCLQISNLLRLLTESICLPISQSPLDMAPGTWCQHKKAFLSGILFVG